MGGGGDDGAQRAAENKEREQASRVAGTTARINSVFNDPGRQGQINDFLEATRGLYREELDRQQGEAARELRFSLARSGQSGGSLATDQGRELGEQAQRATLAAEQGAQGKAASLRAADEEARQRLISMAQSGAEIGDSSAATSLRNNLASARSGTLASELGDAFGNMTSIWKRSEQQSEYRRGLQDYQNQYSPGFGFGGNGGP